MSYVESQFASHATYVSHGSRVEESTKTKHVTMSQSSGTGALDACARCSQSIYPLELMGQIMGLKYHKQCFKCSSCDRNLDFKTYKTNVIDLNDKQIYCSSHTPKHGKGTVDFQANDNYKPQMSHEEHDNVSVGNQAAEIILSVVQKPSKSEEDEEQASSTLRQRSTSKGSLFDAEHAEEATWRDIYEGDNKSFHGSATKLNTQLSNDSAFYKKSHENLENFRTRDYLEFKAGNGHLHSQIKTPDMFRKNNKHGPFDSAYKTSLSHDYGKASWKEIYESNGERSIRSTKKSLDLLDRDELSWREIYENDYRGIKRSTSSDDVNKTHEVYTFEPKDIEPPQPVVVERIIDSMSLDSSLINRVPSKEMLKSDKGERTKSDSYATSTKESSTYHHQLSDQTTQNHVSVMVPMIINNRDSAYRDRSRSPNQMRITKAISDQKEKVLDELIKQTPSKSPISQKKEVVIPIQPPVAEPPKPIKVAQKHVENKILGENRNQGVLKLSVHFDDLRNRLSITCHQAQNLKNVEKKGTSDPYCRIYLVPDDKKAFKRKTKVVKDNLNPKWEETFDYKLSLRESLSKDLIISLKDDKKGLFSKQETRMLGEVRVRLADLDIRRPYTRWYFLQPIGAVSKILLNSGINPYKN